MPTYLRCPKEVTALASEILCQFATHKPLLDARVKIDYVFAYGEQDETGKPIGFAIMTRGNRALGECRKVKLKDRALGRADAEICLDGDWWKDAPDDQRRALLDHELHHIDLKTDKYGNVQKDDLSRPLLTLRNHDVEIGWFSIVAARHGSASMERIQAAKIAEKNGQYFWPQIYGEPSRITMTIDGGEIEFANSAIAAVAMVGALKANLKREKEQEEKL